MLFSQSLPSTTLATIIDDAESPTTFNIVAGGSIIVAIIVNIGSAATGNPIIVRIIISDIVPPPTGTAAINKLAINATIITFPTLGVDPNKYTKNIILNTPPMIEPSLWKLVPNGIVVSAISSDTPMSLAALMLAGILAADEQVEIELDAVALERY